MALRWGFKAEARATASEVRSEIDLGLLDPLDPWKLAEHLEIPVWPLHSYSEIAPDCISVLKGTCQGEFHAMIALVGRARVIVHNDGNAGTRQRSDLCHELAHALLLHEPKAAVPGEPLQYDAEQEEEASWLGGVLLVTDESCLRVCRDGLSLEAAATKYGVSPDLMRWRINKSGARVRVRRERRRQQHGG
jgi:hypothetical protein